MYYLLFLFLFTVDGKYIDKEDGTKEYIDTEQGYSLIIPDWLALRRSDEENTWIGYLSNASNVLADNVKIKAFPKSTFESFDKFKSIYSTSNPFGGKATFDGNYLFYGYDKEENPGRTKTEASYKVYLLKGEQFYTCKFELLSTSKNYILITYTGTRDSYNTYLPKFQELMKGFKLTAH